MLLVLVMHHQTRPAAAAMHLNDKQGALTLRHFDTLFFIDYDVPDDERTAKSLLANLDEFTAFTRQLGYYAKFDANQAPAMATRNPALSAINY